MLFFIAQDLHQLCSRTVVINKKAISIVKNCTTHIIPYFINHNIILKHVHCKMMLLAKKTLSQSGICVSTLVAAVPPLQMAVFSL